MISNMQKIKFIADTASDIPDDWLKKYNIDMVSVPVTIDGVGYFERKSFTVHEFYNLLANAKEIPKTSRVPAEDYLNCYRKAFEEGYTDIINVTINAKGSGTNTSAHMAREHFYLDIPEAAGKINIHIVDSKTYSIAYGYPVAVGAKMAQKGRSTREILDYLADFFDTCEIYLACYSLEYAKKSGRISAASAFVGDVLGVKPIIALIDGDTRVVSKVRGEKQLLGELVKIYEEKRGDKDGFVMAACGSVAGYGIELQEMLQNKLNREVLVFNIGASIAINSGPKIAAVIFRGKKRSNCQ